MLHAQQSAECSAQFRSPETSGGTAATCRHAGIVPRIRHARLDTRSDFSNLRLATPVQRVRPWKATMDRLSWILASLDETKGPKDSVHEQVARHKSRCVLSSHRNGGSTCAKREFVRIPDRHAHGISPAEAARRQPEATQQRNRDGKACRHRTLETRIVSVRVPRSIRREAKPGFLFECLRFAQTVRPAVNFFIVFGL